MKNVVLTVLFALSFVCLNAGTYSGGNGNVDNPYQINTTDDLIELSNTSADWSKYFVQTANIGFNSNEQLVDWDGDGTASWDAGDQSGFSPIGNNSTRFSGEYDGDNYSVNNLYINRSSYDYIGFFGYANNASISGVALLGVDIDGDEYVGGLVGYLYGTTNLSNCNINGNVSGTYRVGGVIGYDNMSGIGSIESIFFNGNVDSDGDNSGVGGFIGEKSGNSVIERCGALGTVTATGRNCGGFVGWTDDGEINQCYSHSDITNSTTTQGRIGGFAGAVAYFNYSYGVINNCYAIGDVSVPNLTSSYDNYGIGGFVGSYYDNSGNKVNNSYAAGLISVGYTNSYIGGFSGEPHSSGSGGTGNFWNTQTSGYSSSQHSGSGETGINTSQMQTQSTFTNAGWNFTTIWAMTSIYNDGFPYVRELFSGGSGSESDPYHISCLDDLSFLTQNNEFWSSYFIQTVNIDAARTQYWDDTDDNADADKFNDPNDGNSNGDNDGFLPICANNASPYFYGGFDGDGHTISNLYINRPTEWYNGLFGLLFSSAGKIKNIGLVNVDITGISETGGLAGRLRYAKDCYTTGSVTAGSGASEVGGFAGNIEGTVENCYSLANVSAPSGGNKLGGFIGEANGYYYGNNVVIENCFAKGNVSGTASNVGGFSGYNNAYEGTVSISNCYSTGSVDGSSGKGGFTGGNTAFNLTVSNCFYDSESSGMGATSASGTGKTSTEMKSFITYTDQTTLGLTTAWDFIDNPYDDVANDNYWGLNPEENNGYPFLAWQGYSQQSAPLASTQATTDIAQNTATGNGNITFLGIANPTQHGVCWRTSENPTTSDSKTEEGGASATGAFTSPITGLASGTTYYVRAYATNNEGTGYGEQVSFTTDDDPDLQLTASAGTASGAYSTLKEAFDAINDGTHQGVITIDVLGDVTESTTAQLNNNVNLTSLTIIPSGGAARTISGDFDGNLIYLSGADNVTFDGLNTGGNSLTLQNSNTGTSATVFNMYSTAQNNTITNCSLKGSGRHPDKGMVHFSNGPSSFEISNCTLGPSGSNKPYNLIYGYGYSSTNPSGITIDNNELYDHFASTYGTHAVYLREVDNVSITGNHFYQTEAVSFSSASAYREVYIWDGSDFTITGNYFGGNTTSCGGNAMNISGASSIRMLYCHAGGSPNTISNNTIANITSNTTADCDFWGIDYSGATFIMENNLIGNMSSPSISHTTTNVSTNQTFMAIGGAYTGAITISSLSNNNIGGISFTANDPSFYGIYFPTSTGSSANITNLQYNTIGGTNDNSITITDNNNSDGSVSFGIQVYPISISGDCNIQHNTVQNISLSGDDEVGFTGIYTKCNVDQNSIHDISSSAYGDLTGIETFYDITSNTIYDLHSTNSGYSGSYFIKGVTNKNGEQDISYNKIYSLDSENDDCIVRGINLEQALSYKSSVFNNEIILGLKSDGTNFGVDPDFTGIYIDNGGEVYFNTIFIAGSKESGFGRSACIYRRSSSSSQPLTLKNNVLANERTSSNYTFRNCVFLENGTSYLAMDNNNYYTLSGYIGYDGSQYRQTLGQWQTATSQDANSISSDPSFTDESNLDFSLTANSPAVGVGVNIDGITDDINGDTRPMPEGTNPDMGAYESDYGIVGWTGASSSSWTDPANWSPAAAPNSAYFHAYVHNNGNAPVISSGVESPAECYNMDIDADACLTINPGKALTVHGALSLAEGKANGRLNILSDATGTGSLIVEGTSSGSVDGQYYVDTYASDKWHYVASPVSGQLLNESWITANSLDNTNGAYQLFRFDEDNNYWIIWASDGNPEAFTDATFVDARGYCLSRSEAGALNMSGSLRTSNVNYPATHTEGKGNGWNMVGNPFSSAMGVTATASSAEDFLAVNAALLDDNYEALYVWDEQSNYANYRNDYKVISNAEIGGLTRISQNYIMPGQAFMAKVNTSGNLQFNTAMQAHAAVGSFKSKENWPYFELIAENDTRMNATAVGFHYNMTSGLDPSYDAAKLKGNTEIALYTRLVEDNGHDFAIQALPYSRSYGFEIPVGLDLAEEQEITFSINQEGMDDSKIILEDRKAGIFTNLLEKNFTVLAAGDGTGRFFLHVGNITGVDVLKRETLHIFAYVSGNLIHINSNEKLAEPKILLMDVTGRLLGSYENTQSIPAPKTAGVYLVTIETDNERITEKITIQ